MKRHVPAAAAVLVLGACASSTHIDKYVAKHREYEPAAYLPWISPTPLLMVVAAGDHLTVSDLATRARCGRTIWWW